MSNNKEGKEKIFKKHHIKVEISEGLEVEILEDLKVEILEDLEMEILELKMVIDKEILNKEEDQINHLEVEDDWVKNVNYLRLLLLYLNLWILILQILIRSDIF